MPARAALRRYGAIAALTIAGLVGSALTIAPPASATSGPPLIIQRLNHAANVAIDHIGAPYHYGSSGPGSFDCSGLMLWSYDHSHMSLPRSAAAQYAAVHHIIKAHLVRGDLVFFHDSRGHVYHVAMFLYWN